MSDRNSAVGWGVRLGSAVCLFGSLSAAVILGEAAPTGSVVRFRIGPHREVIVPVMVEGGGPYPFALDTGSSHSSIASGLAARVDASAVAQTTVSTPAGDCLCPVVRVRTLSAGTLRAFDVLATAVPDHQLDPEGRFVGVLGQDVLAGAPYTIDYDRRTVTWNDERPAGGIEFRLQRTAYGTYLVDVPQAVGHVRFVPDSGAETLVLFERDAAPPVVPVRYDAGTVAVSTLASGGAARTARVSDLRLGPIRWRNRAAVVLALDHAPDAHGDGLLPLHAFSRVTVDAPRATLTVVER